MTLYSKHCSKSDKKDPYVFLEPKKTSFSLYNSMEDGNYNNVKVDKKINKLAEKNQCICQRMGSKNANFSWQNLGIHFGPDAKGLET